MSGCRDIQGRFFAAYHDTTASPKVTKVYTSSDDGATWVAETWSQSLGTGANNLDGGDKPILLVDNSGVVWLVMRSFDGGNPVGPCAIKREADKQTWGGIGFFQFFANLSTKTVTASGATFTAAIDPELAIVGFPNIVTAFQDSGDGKIYVSEIKGGPSTHKDLGTGTEPRIVFTSGGTGALVFRSGTSMKYSSRVPNGAVSSWTGAVNIHDSGDSVTSVEDAAITEGGMPAGLYRYNKSGTNVLKLVEHDGSEFVYTEVTDGTDRESYPGASLAYDSLGSVFVTAVVDFGGANPIPVTYGLLRGIGSSSWGANAIEATATATSQDTVAMKRNVPSLVGYMPMRSTQGSAVWYLKDNGELWWYIPDVYPGTGAYPTIFSTIHGERPYREADANTRSHYVLTAEGSPATSFPDIAPHMEFRVSKVFQTSEVEFEAGYRAVIAVHPSGRRTVAVNFVAVNDADKDTLVDFLDARMADQETFDFTIPDTEEVVPVFIVDGRHQHSKIGPGVWSVGEFLFMESITA